jgi:hypothetical protein
MHSMKPLLSLLIIINLIIVGSIKLNELDDEDLLKIIKEKNISSNLNFLEETPTDDEKADKDLSFEDILTKKG